uniref:PISTILLATA-like protein n=1 Tax=Pachysandra terminalis TaxID=74825 RepID=D3XL49_PACTE|nr:PISTILLATA-like protein [Pachysandra terminalis]
MGRGKIDIKRIENPTNRQVTFSKRKNGILKKAKEITVLCDAKVALLIISSSGKIIDYCSPNTNLIDMLAQFQSSSGKRLWDAKHEYLNSEIERIRKENDTMQIKLRHPKGEDILNLSYKDCMCIEEALEDGLEKVRSKRIEKFKIHKQKEQELEEENRHLFNILHQQQMIMEGNARGMENVYRHEVKDDYPPQMPFAFRVLPSHPNLQERK